MAITREEANAGYLELARLYPGLLAFRLVAGDTTRAIWPGRDDAWHERHADMVGGYVPDPQHPPGYIALVLQHVRDKDELGKVLRHEYLGHLGINTFAPSDKALLLTAIEAARDEPSLIELWTQVATQYHAQSLRMQAEEVFAACAEGVSPRHITAGGVVSRGLDTFDRACRRQDVPLTLKGLTEITEMVAQGLYERTRIQRTFPNIVDPSKGSLMEAKKPFHEIVTERIVKQLEAGTAPWQRPWQGEGGGWLPRNPISGKRYKGINTLMLMTAAIENGWSDNRWMTFKQAQGVGAQVRKGEHGTPIQFWTTQVEKNVTDAKGKPILNKDGKPKKQTVMLEQPIMRFSTVFNTAQIDGLPASLQIPAQDKTWAPIERAERILNASGAKIQHIQDGKAFYRPSTDTIHLPERNQFPAADGYYAIALHELGHWTGHPSRLDRDLAHPFGSEGYAREELRAEIASMIVGEELGIGHDPDQHVAYVGEWIKVLQKDPLEIAKAAADAEKIQAFVLSLEQQQEQQQEQANMTKLIPLKDQLTQAIERVSASTATLDRRVEGREYDEIVGLARQGFETQQTTAGGSDPVAQGVNRMLGPEQREAMSLARALAVHDVAWASALAAQGSTPAGPAIDPFVEHEALSKAYNSEARFALTQAQQTNADPQTVAADPEMEELYREAQLADETFHAELVRVYGESNAGDDRYRMHHDDEAVQAAANHFVATSTAWINALQRAREQSHAPVARPPVPAATAEEIFVALDANFEQYEKLVADHDEKRSAYESAHLAMIDKATEKGQVPGPDLPEAKDVATLLAIQTQALNDLLNFVAGQPVLHAYHLIRENTQDYGAHAADMIEVALIEAGITQEQKSLAERYADHREALVLEQQGRPTQSTSSDDDHYSDATLKALVADYGWEPASHDQLGTLTGVSIAFEQEHKAVASYENDSARRRYLDLHVDGKYVQDWDGRNEPPASVAARVHAVATETVGLRPMNTLSAPADDQALSKTDIQEATNALRDAPSNNRRGPQQGWLAVPYAERKQAMAHGAGWDAVQKSWYAREGADMSKLAKWLPTESRAAKPAADTVRDEFAAALKDFGFNLDAGDHPIMDGKLHRVPLQGAKRGTLDGMYVGHMDGHPAGFMQNHKTGDKQNWSSKGYQLTEQQRAELRAEAAAKLEQRAEKERLQHELTSQRIHRRLATLTPIREGEQTPYLRSKGIAPTHGAFTDKDRETTYLPAVDVHGKTWTMQYINADGTKRFAREGRLEGNFHPVGGLDALKEAPAIVIGEGYATAKTASDSLGFATVAAFTSSNLLAVSLALHERFPDKPIVIVGDDDKLQEIKIGKNPGREKAQEAAQAVGGVALLPIFAVGEQSERPQDFTDFNDLAQRSILGREGVARQLNPVVREAIEKAKVQKTEKQAREVLIEEKQTVAHKSRMG